MEIKITNDKPWFNQLDDLKLELTKIALESNTQENAAKLLGISERWIRNKIVQYPELKKFDQRKYRKTKIKLNDRKKIKGLFEIGYSLKQLSDKFKLSIGTVSRILRLELNETKYKQLLQQTKEKKKMEKHEIIENNRQIVAIIAEKIRDNKMEELSTEELFYAKILHSNGFITQKGEVTKLGKEALYN